MSRPELNGRRGTVVTAADKKSGRVGVRVEGEDAPIALKPANLIDTAAEAMAAVFADADLLRLIFENVERWERAGVLSAVCTVWRSVVWSHADLYRSIVVLAPDELKTSALAVKSVKRSRGFIRARQYSARFMLEEGALPRLTRDLPHIPDPAWVENLYVVLEPDLLESFLYCAPPFPRLASAFILRVDDYCDAPGHLDGKRLKAKSWRSWLSNHSSTLRHLSVDSKVELTQHPRLGLVRTEDTVQIFDVAAQPGLASLRLDGTYGASQELETVRGWSKAARRSLTALDLTDYPSLDDLIKLVELLPELRRLSWKIGGPDAETFLDLAAVLSRHSKLEALYLTMDSAEELPIDIFDPFVQVRTLLIALLPLALL